MTIQVRIEYNHTLTQKQYQPDPWIEPTDSMAGHGEIEGRTGFIAQKDNQI
jgi:hypothetical protein